MRTCVEKKGLSYATKTGESGGSLPATSRALRAVVNPEAAADDKDVANYLKWANVVLRTAALLSPYQQPTYRAIEVRTDRAEDERSRRFDISREFASVPVTRRRYPDNEQRIATHRLRRKMARSQAERDPASHRKPPQQGSFS